MMQNMQIVDKCLVDNIVTNLKSQGVFDNFRKDCLADIDTKPAYQNLRQRVEGFVSSFLETQEWRTDLNKNQLRDAVRKKIIEAGMLEVGVDRVVEQVLNPKISQHIYPRVETAVFEHLTREKIAQQVKSSPPVPARPEPANSPVAPPYEPHVPSSGTPSRTPTKPPPKLIATKVIKSEEAKSSADSDSNQGKFQRASSVEEDNSRLSASSEDLSLKSDVESAVRRLEYSSDSSEDLDDEKTEARKADVLIPSEYESTKAKELPSNVPKVKEETLEKSKTSQSQLSKTEINKPASSREKSSEKTKRLSESKASSSDVRGRSESRPEISSKEHSSSSKHKDDKSRRDSSASSKSSLKPRSSSAKSESSRHGSESSRSSESKRTENSSSSSSKPRSSSTSSSKRPDKPRPKSEDYSEKQKTEILEKPKEAEKKRSEDTDKQRTKGSDDSERKLKKSKSEELYEKRTSKTEDTEISRKVKEERKLSKKDEEESPKLEEEPGLIEEESGIKEEELGSKDEKQDKKQGRKLKNPVCRRIQRSESESLSPISTSTEDDIPVTPKLESIKPKRDSPVTAVGNTGKTISSSPDTAASSKSLYSSPATSSSETPSSRRASRTSSQHYDTSDLYKPRPVITRRAPKDRSHSPLVTEERTPVRMSRRNVEPLPDEEIRNKTPEIPKELPEDKPMPASRKRGRKGSVDPLPQGEDIRNKTPEPEPPEKELPEDKPMPASRKRIRRKGSVDPVPSDEEIINKTPESEPSEDKPIPSRIKSSKPVQDIPLEANSVKEFSDELKIEEETPKVELKVAQRAVVTQQESGQTTMAGGSGVFLRRKPKVMVDSNASSSHFMLASGRKRTKLISAAEKASKELLECQKRMRCGKITQEADSSSEASGKNEPSESEEELL